MNTATRRVSAATPSALRRWKLPPALFRPLVKRIWGLRTGEDLGALEPESTIRGLRLPLLLTHGDRDPLIPDRELDRLVRVAPGGTEVLRLPGAAHSDLTEFPVYRDGVLDFLTRHAGRGNG